MLNKWMKVIAPMILTAVVSAAPAPVFAAPKQMPDGQIFDAEYYAAHNPDVVKAFGTDENLLYWHYTVCGKKEGRLPMAAEAKENIDPLSAIRAQCVYNAMQALMAQHPEGSEWTAAQKYTMKWMKSNTVQMETGYGSHAFALLFSDTAFAEGTPFRKIPSCPVSSMRAGDVVCLNDGPHSVVILSKNANGAVVAEGDLAGKMHWGRYVTNAELGANAFVLTR